MGNLFLVKSFQKLQNLISKNVVNRHKMPRNSFKSYPIVGQVSALKWVYAEAGRARVPCPLSACRVQTEDTLKS